MFGCLAVHSGCKTAAPKDGAGSVTASQASAVAATPSAAAVSTVTGSERFAASMASVLALAAQRPTRANDREVTAADIAKLVNRATPDAVPGEPIPVPPLHPILGQPFFEDVAPDLFCEAISSKEPDLWVRFGHLVPLYMQGAIYVLQAGRQREVAIADFIVNEYTVGQIFQQASCGDKTLLYVTNLVEETDFEGQPYGRAHLGASLNVKLGLQVLEFFGFDDQRVRFAGYCRANADACEAIMKLNLLNEGTGLCPWALHDAGADANEAQHNELCKRLPASMKVCGLAYDNRRKDEKRLFFECQCRLRDALGLRKVAECVNANL